MEHVFEPIGPHGLTMMCCHRRPAGVPGRRRAGHRGRPLGRGDTRSARCWSPRSPTRRRCHGSADRLGVGADAGRARHRPAAQLARRRSSPTRPPTGPAGCSTRPVLCVRGRGRAAGPRRRGLTLRRLGRRRAYRGRRPPTTSTTTCRRCSRRCARTGTSRCATSTRSRGGGWVTPVALLAALMSDPRTVDAVLDACLPVGDRWLPAARDGLADRGDRHRGRDGARPGRPRAARHGPRRPT